MKQPGYTQDAATQANYLALAGGELVLLFVLLCVFLLLEIMFCTWFCQALCGMGAYNTGPVCVTMQCACESTSWYTHVKRLFFH